MTGDSPGREPVATDTAGEASAAVLAAAAAVGLQIAADEVAGVAAHLALLRGFAAVVGDPSPEPAAVFRP